MIKLFTFVGTKILSIDGKCYKYKESRRNPGFPWTELTTTEYQEYFSDDKSTTELDDFKYEPSSGMYVKNDQYKFLDVEDVKNYFQIDTRLKIPAGVIKENEYGLPAIGYVIRKKYDDGRRLSITKTEFTKNKDKFAVFPNIISAKNAANKIWFRTDILEVEIKNKNYKELRYIR